MYEPHFLIMKLRGKFTFPGVVNNLSYSYVRNVCRKSVPLVLKRTHGETNG